MATVNRPGAPQNYRTPRAFLDAVEKRFGPIQWDAACTTEDCVAPMGRGYRRDSACDALARDWDELGGALVWCNPPFKHSGRFAAKASDATLPRILLLCQASIDSNWFAEYVHGRALVLALNPRLTFVGEKAPINRALMLCAYNFGQTGFETWRWQEKTNASKRPDLG